MAETRVPPKRKNKGTKQRASATEGKVVEVEEVSDLRDENRNDVHLIM